MQVRISRSIIIPEVELHFCGQPRITVCDCVTLYKGALLVTYSRRHWILLEDKYVSNERYDTQQLEEASHSRVEVVVSDSTDRELDSFLLLYVRDYN